MAATEQREGEKESNTRGRSSISRLYCREHNKAVASCPLKVDQPYPIAQISQLGFFPPPVGPSSGRFQLEKGRRRTKWGSWERQAKDGSQNFQGNI
jgi:hypothetical protein